MLHCGMPLPLPRASVSSFGNWRWGELGEGERGWGEGWRERLLKGFFQPYPENREVQESSKSSPPDNMAAMTIDSSLTDTCCVTGKQTPKVWKPSKRISHHLRQEKVITPTPLGLMLSLMQDSLVTSYSLRQSPHNKCLWNRTCDLVFPELELHCHLSLKIFRP